MVINRRSLLKMMLIAPAAFQASPVLEALCRANDQPADNMVHIYLVGLFVMEFQDRGLVLVTPQFDHHEFFTFDFDGHPHGTLDEYINLWDRLKPGSIYEFSPQNLKFQASLISNGYLLHPESPHEHKHRCTIVLPKPDAISAEIQQPVCNFDPDSKSTVGAAIKKEATDANVKCFGSVTHLQYQPQDGVNPFRIAYVALHKPLTRDTVNDALNTVKPVCGQGWDVQMHSILTSNSGNCNYTCDDQKKRTKDLESLLRSLGGPGEATNVDVASCPQFGIHQ